MNYTIHKLFIDYEKEEKWLNEMSNKGYSLVNYNWFNYTFIKCKPSQYKYRILILEKNHKHNDNNDYLDSINCHNEIITTYKKKVYLRKISNNDDFEIDTDIRIKINYYEKIFTLFYLLAICQFAIGLGNILVANNAGNAIFSIIIGAIILLLGIFFSITMVIPLYKRIRKYRKQLQSTN